MSLPAPNHRRNHPHKPDHDRAILAPVPQRRNQPFPNYTGFVSRIDSTIAPGTWNCGCGNSFGPAYGVKAPSGAQVDPGTVQGGAFYSEINCTGERASCSDPNALTYDTESTVNSQKACIYPVSTAHQDCNSARAPPNGCTHYPWKHSHD